jgi:sulfite exporter TauE/SafE
VGHHHLYSITGQAIEGLIDLQQQKMIELFAPFVIGFIGSGHCLGMCGPLILAYSFHVKGDRGQAKLSGASPIKKGLSHHLTFHFGRILSYGLFGALAAALFYLVGSSRFFINLRGGVTLLGGSLMILLGLVLLKIMPLPTSFSLLSVNSTSFLKRLPPVFIHSQRLGSRMALGIATGFLPCGLSWSMIVKAATTQNIEEGFLTMVAFGLGTLPVLFLAGFSASFLSLKTRVLGEKVAALSVIAMGLILIFKGARIFV